LDDKEPDMVILDIHLGSKETLEEVRAIRVSASWRKLPVLMTSAIDRRQACLRAGANDFILKPFDWQVLLERVNKMRDNFIYQEV
jgi:DNA-binding response OmpR family regulator